MARKHVQIQDSEVEFPADVTRLHHGSARRHHLLPTLLLCIAGYQVDELVGHNHNLVRHPDMPKAAFADLWDRPGRGQPWRGVRGQNRCRDIVRYYWSRRLCDPIYENGKISGYQSVRCQTGAQLETGCCQAYQATAPEPNRAAPAKLPSCTVPDPFCSAC